MNKTNFIVEYPLIEADHTSPWNYRVNNEGFCIIFDDGSQYIFYAKDLHNANPFKSNTPVAEFIVKQLKYHIQNIDLDELLKLGHILPPAISLKRIR